MKKWYVKIQRENVLSQFSSLPGVSFKYLNFAGPDPKISYVGLTKGPVDKILDFGFNCPVKSIDPMLIQLPTLT